MRIPCPHCGERSVDEFIVHGAADLVRPEGSTRMEDWIDYVYLRENAFGRHRELFYHGGGCRAWLVVTRDTRTHAVTEVAGLQHGAVQDGAAQGGAKSGSKHP